MHKDSYQVAGVGYYGGCATKEKDSLCQVKDANVSMMLLQRAEPNILIDKSAAIDPPLARVQLLVLFPNEEESRQND